LRHIIVPTFATLSIFRPNAAKQLEDRHFAKCSCWPQAGKAIGGGKGGSPGEREEGKKKKEEGRRYESYRRIPCKEQENPPTGMSYLINK
jgi:hypothetical protein